MIDIASFLKFCAEPNELNEAYQHLKSVVSNPSRNAWFLIADELHIAYDPSDSSAVDCVSYLLIKDRVDSRFRILDDWVNTHEKDMRSKVDHIYEAVTLEDYDELVRDGKDENYAVKVAIEAFENSPDLIFTDHKLTRAIQNVVRAAEEYMEYVLDFEKKYIFTFVFDIPKLSYILGAIFVLTGVFFIYRDFAIYKHLQLYPYLEVYRKHWNNTCLFSAFYVLTGILDLVMPEALKRSSNEFLWNIARIAKPVTVIACIILVLLIVAMGSEFFEVY